MPILNIRHITTYRYHQPVAFGAHRMMLLPRDDDDQKVLHSALEITPKPHKIAWARDHPRCRGARPRDAVPLQGTWYGRASDHLAMQVVVRVNATDGGTFAPTGP